MSAEGVAKERTNRSKYDRRLVPPRRCIGVLGSARAFLQRQENELSHQSIIGPAETPRAIGYELANCDGAKRQTRLKPARSIDCGATWRSQAGATSYEVADYGGFGAP